MKHVSGICSALIVAGLVVANAAVPTQAQAQSPVAEPSGNVFEEFAKEIMSGIHSTSRNQSPVMNSSSEKAYLKKDYAYIGGKKLRFAVWPFHKDKIPIAKSIADGFNDRLLAALLKTQEGNIEIVARDALKAIIADMSATGALDEDDDPIAALMAKARNVDALIQGRMRLVEGGLSLGYKVARMDGTILAQTARVILPLKAQDKSTLNDLLTVDQAVSQASNFFADNLRDISEVRVGGLHYQETGLQPPFAAFFKDRFVTALQAAYSNVLTGRSLKIKESRLMRELDGMPLKENKFSKIQSSYLLTGRYWVLNRVIELKLTLKNPAGYTLSWSGRMPISAVKGIRIKPAGDFEHLRENDGLGPFEFNLTSTRGRNPVYQIGDEMTLLLRLGEDAWTYCFYHQADGKVIQIFPNPHFWREFKSPRLAGGKIHSIPGKKLFPFDLKVTAPVGRELVKCFGASRDVTEDLPRDLRGRSLKPMSRTRVDNLSALFRKLPYAAISEASLVVTVIE
tara:strand:- start:3478 stop:5010 length:1533 start_codon:yes stop_codon:yes gene_type:complete